jgi:2,4-dienoyl-CoA reductase-like NADH-dependent reductase (Old Yellow Enzyme family)
MSQYSARDHQPTSWHLAHYVTRAQTMGLTMVEATAISPQGRGTPQDLGIWDDAHIEPMTTLARAIADVGSVPGLQLSHAGRKGSRTAPHDGNRPLASGAGGWEIVGPSALPYAEGYQTPAEMTTKDIAAVVKQYRDAALRAYHAGFQVLEVHGGHGRLLHTFYSPISNRRRDEYGGSWDNRTRLVRDVIVAIRKVWPDDLPLALRLSCLDWSAGGWTIDESVALAERVRGLGVDLIDCSSGGVCRETNVNSYPGYQVPFARRIRQGSGIATAAVGLIGSAKMAERILSSGAADLVLIGRRTLLDPYFLLNDGEQVGATVPYQYERGVRSLAEVYVEHIPEL